LKLLFDENLASRLVQQLADLFPRSTHVQIVGLDSASDHAIWEFAKTSGFVVVTKDKDFENLSVVFGAPPKVVLLQVGNCSVKGVEERLRRDAIRIAEFDTSDKALLILR
jgi:predicted nuclease of predicted toxin-antitoxin system